VLGLLEDPEIEVALGVSLQRARDALDAIDREALGALGIDASVDAPPIRMRDVPSRPTMKAVLTDRLRMTPMAKTVLQEAGRPMRRGSRIQAQQVLLRLLDLQRPDPAAALLSALDVDTDEVRLHLV